MQDNNNLTTGDAEGMIMGFPELDMIVVTRQFNRTLSHILFDANARDIQGACAKFIQGLVKSGRSMNPTPLMNLYTPRYIAEDNRYTTNGALSDANIHHGCFHTQNLEHTQAK